ncbi:MAG: hypothetical protein IJY61_02995 [Candidatus Gastranaerophilales bacterium]|nr:hypothetical protein [Candidatus Gastranaerophilales bacterium]
MNKQNIISNKEIFVYFIISMFLSMIEILIPTVDITYKEKIIWYLLVFCFSYIHITILLIVNFIFKFIDIKNNKIRRIIKIILRILAIIYILLLIFMVDFSYMLATADFGQ